MADLSKRACLYVLMYAACNLVYTQEQICLWLCLQYSQGGPLHLHHPLHTWDFYQSWYLFCHCFYTMTLMIGYHCIHWSWLTPVYSFSGQINGTGVTIGVVLYLCSVLFLQTTLLLVSCGNAAVPCNLYTSLILVFHGDGGDLTLCCLHYSATCILQRWRGSSSVHPAQLCYLYSVLMVQIFFCFTHIS